MFKIELCIYPIGSAYYKIQYNLVSITEVRVQTAIVNYDATKKNINWCAKTSR